jgi:hypothetical protein
VFFHTGAYHRLKSNDAPTLTDVVSLDVKDHSKTRAEKDGERERERGAMNEIKTTPTAAPDVLYSTTAGGCLPLPTTTTTQKTYAIWVVKVGNASLGSRHLLTPLCMCSF